jgi:ribonuclease J
MNAYPLKVIPLGGFGEIGKNMLVLEYDQDIIVIDVGLRFPDQHLYGVDFIIPDLSYIEQNKKKVRALILTHGHEDHIGGVPYFLSKLKVPIYGTRLTLGLLKNKFNDFKLNDNPLLHEVKPRDRLTIGQFRVEFININHSIAGSLALAIQTPLGTLIHTGDIKIDSNPVDQSLFDYYTFARHGENGVLLLMSDSTNAEREGYTKSEYAIKQRLGEIVQNAEGRVILASFASNIHRLQQIIQILRQQKRKIALSGLSMLRNIELAQQLGYLETDDMDFINLTEIKYHNAKDLAVITTGSQGESLSALTRIAHSNHPQISIEPGDTVILSASVIPGNEKAVGNIINRLLRLGAHVEYNRHESIHVSGHASREELKTIFNMVRPKFFVPVHGEYRHLLAHVHLAQEMRVPPENMVLPANGDILLVEPNKIRKKGNVPAQDIYVDGSGIGDIGPSVLKERSNLAEHGIVMVALALSQDWLLLEEPRVSMMGVLYNRKAEPLLQELRELTYKVVEKWRSGKRKASLENKLRSGLRRLILSRIGRKPNIHIEIFNTPL